MMPPSRLRRRGALIHPAWVRITHWINAVAVIVMIGSGWEIYNASPLFAFVFPHAITLGGWLAGAPALALRGHVGAGREWSRLPRRWASQAAGSGASSLPIRADRRAGRCRRGADGQALAMTISRSTTPCRGCSISASSSPASSSCSPGLRSGSRCSCRSSPRCSAAMMRARYVHFFAMAAIVAVPRDSRDAWRCWCRRSLRAMITGR